MLEHVFLESRLLLFAVWIIVQLGVIGYWSWRRTRAAHRSVWVGLVALPCLLLLSTWVVTRRESLMQSCHTMARHIERGEIDAFGEFLSGDFTAAGLDRSEFVERVESALSRFHINRLKLKRFAFDFDSDGEATVEFSATCHVRTTDAYYDRAPSRWRLHLRRGGSEWRITSIEVVPTPLSPVHRLEDWLGR